MVDFAGWEMPIQYSSIVAEHNAVRQAAGLFDVGHMGRISVRGPEAVTFLDWLLTNDIAGLNPGQARYSLVCNAGGGVLDDILVYRLAEDQFLLVVNASNRARMIAWIGSHCERRNIEFDDTTLSGGMIALQGPRAQQILQPLVDRPLADVGSFSSFETAVDGTQCLVSRTGYTGEDGFELIVPAQNTEAVWTKLMSLGAPQGLVPCGLGCRDTLRLEAGMPLYGHELDDTIDPITAGLGFAVKLSKDDFIGKAALAEKKMTDQRPHRVGLVLEGRRIARERAEVYWNGEAAGHVTSGTFSPTLNQSLAMAYVRPECAAPGTTLSVDIRGTSVPATVVKLPFYRRSKAG